MLSTGGKIVIGSFIILLLLIVVLAITGVFNSKSNNESSAYLGVYDLPKEAVYDNTNRQQNIGIDTFKNLDTIEGIRNSYLDLFKSLSSVYNETYKESVFDNFPKNASTNTKLLGSYIINTPFCTYLERTSNPNQFQIKLNGLSINNELNTVSSILREKVNFFNQILFFNVDRTKKYDFLDLSYILYNNQKIYKNDSMWLKLVKSAYSEIFNIIQIKHALWHLKVSSIIFKSQKHLIDSPIKEIFDIASNSVYVKSAEITAIINLDIAFGQTLANNPRFNKFALDHDNNFENNFNIDTIFTSYFCLNNSDPNLNWLPGMKSNIEIIKTFVDKVISKYQTLNKSKLNSVISFLTGYNLQNDIYYLKKLLYMLFTVGTAFHSTTIDFGKICLTDIFDVSFWKKAGVFLLLGTIATDFPHVFGDKVLYSGKNFDEEISWLESALYTNRNIIHNNIVYNKPLYKNTTFSNKEDMNRTGATNSYTTYF